MYKLKQKIFKILVNREKTKIATATFIEPKITVHINSTNTTVKYLDTG